MKLHYEKRCNIKFLSETHTIIPVLPDLIFLNIYKIKNYFCYIGSMSKWQCIDARVKIFIHKFSSLDNSRLYIATRETEKAIKVSKKNIISNYTLVTLENRNEIAAFLNKMEF